jgi:hypothetical protein
VPNARDGKFAPPTAQFAVREARHLASNLLALVAGGPTRAFSYKARGAMAAIGHRKGVADVFGIPLSGLPAWLLWRAYYLSQMPTLGRKLRLFVEWTWGMFFPTDITHLRFMRSHEIEADSARPPEESTVVRVHRAQSGVSVRDGRDGASSRRSVSNAPRRSTISQAISPITQPRRRYRHVVIAQSRARASQSILVASLLSLAVAAPAFAGECPKDKVGNNPLPGAATAPVGVMEMELASIDLAKESVKLPERRLRYRHMEIQPGGVVPLHSHADRPALIMVNQGQISSTAASASCRSRTRPVKSPASRTASSTGGRTRATWSSC